MPSHPLLLTPFRYPPLISGSRFGRPHQRHLFYGARALEPALAERSFHALRMLEDSPLPRGARVQRLQTAFTVEITAERGLALQEHLTLEALATITDPSSDEASQRCSDSMRERGVQAFEVPSARSPQTPPVVGVLTPYAFSSTPFDFLFRQLDPLLPALLQHCSGAELEQVVLQKLEALTGESWHLSPSTR
jgi:hypothetical protein